MIVLSRLNVTIIMSIGVLKITFTKPICTVVFFPYGEGG